MSASAHRRLHDPRYLVGHWPLNGHARDVSGHGNHITGVRAPKFTTGPFSSHQIGTLTGNNHWEGGTGIGALLGAACSSASISCMVYATSVAGNDGVVSISSAFGLTSGKMELKVGFETWGLKVGAVSSSTPATANSWVHLVGSWNGATQSLYVNSVPLDSDANTTALDFTGLASGFGVYYLTGSGGGFCLNGSLANVRLYNIALTGDEIFSLYEYDKR